MAKRRLISIICPGCNEEAAVSLFYERLQAVLRPMREQYYFELIFTNNRSTDGTLPAIRKLRENDKQVIVLMLTRGISATKRAWRPGCLTRAWRRWW